jgi:hypothetical protein
MKTTGIKHSPERLSRRSPLIRFLYVILISVLMVVWSASSLAEDQAAVENPAQEPGWDIDRWTVYTSVYTKHFDPDPDHVNNQKRVPMAIVPIQVLVFQIDRRPVARL